MEGTTSGASYTTVEAQRWGAHGDVGLPRPRGRKKRPDGGDGSGRVAGQHPDSEC